MKFILPTILLLGVCDAQFGGGFGGFGGATQNCAGSQCNQNNFGRKKREIVDAINALTEETLEAEKQAEAEAIEIQKRDAEPQFFGGGFGGATQNCAGSQCNQNNFGRRKREVVAKLIEEALKIAEDEEAAERQEAEAVHSQEKREAQVQNCQGSSCNQNNLGGGFAGLGAGFPVGGGFGAGFGGGATQNCVGSQCNQNNGRRKREIIAALLEEVL